MRYLNLLRLWRTNIGTCKLRLNSVVHSSIVMGSTTWKSTTTAFPVSSASTNLASE